MIAMDEERRSVSAWLAYLDALHSKTIDMGLERIRAVHAALGPDLRCPVITVTGTNGKGSTCAMLEAILSEAGYRVGLYTSPHLLHYNERVRIGSVAVTDAQLCESFRAVEQARNRTRTATGRPTSLTYFEFGTLAALRQFSRAGLDVAILEVGLGGRLDAVNIVDPDVAVVTTVDIDHTDYLGPTRQDIGREKAGIFRKGRVAICGEPNPPASIMAVATAHGTDLRRIGNDYGYRMDRDRWHYWSSSMLMRDLKLPALRGSHQVAKAATAVASLQALGPTLMIEEEEAIRKGLTSVRLPARFQRLRDAPRVIVDVAHNPHAARALATTLAQDHAAAHTCAVFGCMADKDIAGIMLEMRDSVDEWYLASLPGSRGASSETLRTTAVNCGIDPKSVRTCSNPESAYVQARREASRTSTIVILGSFLTAAAAARIEGLHRESPIERNTAANVESFALRARKAGARFPV